MEPRTTPTVKVPEGKGPWWVLPTGRIHPLWWLAVVPPLIWIDYAGGPDTQFPTLFVIPVLAAAWYSGPWPAVLLALGVPAVHLLFLLNVWEPPPGLSLLATMTVVRGATVALLALMFARQSEHERELRRELERLHAAQLRAEQLRVVHLTMRTVQDIVNNCLNQLQLLRMDAEGHVPDESLVAFDRAIREASDQLRALADLGVFKETQMEIGPAVDANAARR